MKQVYPFPGEVVGSPETDHEDAILAFHNSRIGKPVYGEVTNTDAKLTVCEIPRTLGGFSVTAAYPDITVVDPGMLDRFIEGRRAQT